MRDTMTYTPTCPYVTDVEVQAWGEGLTFSLHEYDYLGRNESNPYTSGDTCVAWAQGYDDAKYNPAPFNPADMNDMTYEQKRYIGTSLFHEMQDGEKYGDIKASHLLYSWTGGSLVEGKPAWADNIWQHRSVQLNHFELTGLVRRSVHNTQLMGEGSVELPCPPYKYEYSGGGMSITAGPFTKWGSQEDWTNVLQDMQRHLDDAPAGINVGNVSINVDVAAPATMRWTTQVEVEELLAYHDSYDDGTWTGSMDDLEQALTDAVDELSSSDVGQNYYEDVETEVDDYADWEIEAQDIGYDLEEAEEL
jgi:hypothetical protein